MSINPITLQSSIYQYSVGVRNVVAGEDTQANILTLPTTTLGVWRATDTGRFFQTFNNTWRRRFFLIPQDIGLEFQHKESTEFFNAFPPIDVVISDGQLLGVTDYPAYVAKFGATHGGNGTTTSGTPNKRGRFDRAANLSSGTDPDHASRTGGQGTDKIGSTQAHSLASHSHNYNDKRATTVGNTAFGASGVLSNTWYNGTTDEARVTATTGATETRGINISYLPLIVVRQI